jgi:DNA-binding phage protein
MSRIPTGPSRAERSCPLTQTADQRPQRVPPALKFGQRLSLSRTVLEVMAVRNIRVTYTLLSMTSELTGAERYFATRREDPSYEASFREAQAKIAQIDGFVRSLDQRREALRLSKAELGRRAGLRPEAVRRLFSSRSPNPTLSTVIAITQVLDLEVSATPHRSNNVTSRQSVGPRTRHETV